MAFEALITTVVNEETEEETVIVFEGEGSATIRKVHRHQIGSVREDLRRLAADGDALPGLLYALQGDVLLSHLQVEA